MRVREPQHRGGFTLLELLMVVIIIAILAAMALPQYVKVAEKSRATEAYNILGAIRSAENRYRAQSPNNDYTGTLADLDVEIPATFQDWNTPDLTNITGNAGAGVPSKGFVTMARKQGDFKDQTIGLQLGDGGRCGTFKPVFTADVTCAQR